MICKEAYAVYTEIFRALETQDTLFLKCLFNTYVRPVLKSSLSVWAPHLTMDIARIECVQKLFTKPKSFLQHLAYEEQLLTLNHKFLEYRSTFLNLVLLYKFI